MRQYNRTKLTKEGLFKASLYSYRSNHGQFNSVWGNTDYGWPMNLFLNKKPLLEGEEQRTIAKVYFTAFLDATLKNKKKYIPVFKDYRYAASWLPEDVYVSRYADNKIIHLCTFEEDVDVTSGTQPGVTIKAENFKLWKEYDMKSRQGGTKENNTLTLGWRNDTSTVVDSIKTNKMDTIPNYIVNFPYGLLKEYDINKKAYLTFSAANTKENIPEGKSNKSDRQDDLNSLALNSLRDSRDEEGENKEKEDLPIQVDFSVKLKDAEGNIASIALSEFAYIPPVMESKFIKWGVMNSRYGEDYEVTLQDFRIPLNSFTENNPELQIDKLVEIAFVFDKTPEGAVVIDDIGLSKN
ncbi:MAG: hypothetical protein ACLFPH_05430 [Bacteroidales bacterium]